MKRIFDICISLVGLVILSPLLFIIAILIKFNLGSPILFKQQRPGLKGIPFYLYKFRSMSNQRDSKGKLLPDKQRMTPFGVWLRRFSLDELPQLINVLKGDLSLVGPRPLLMEYLPLYNKEQAKRHLVKPGITGWAQVNGRNAITWEEKFELDIWYVNHQTFWVDMKILGLTIVKVIKSEGIDQDEHHTMAHFKGTNNNEKMHISQ